jgi:hypothetical protein
MCGQQRVLRDSGKGNLQKNICVLVVESYEPIFSLLHVSKVYKISLKAGHRVGISFYDPSDKNASRIP